MKVHFIYFYFYKQLIMKNLIYSLCLILAFTACKNQAHIVDGKITGAENQTINLDQLYFNGSANPIGSATADANGTSKCITTKLLQKMLHCFC